MKPGTYESIRYKAPDGTPRTAWLTPTADVHNPGVPFLEHAEDPQWIVKNPDGSKPIVEWMLFHATDGSSRKCRIASHYEVAPPGPAPGEYIWSEFVIAKPDGSDERRDREIWFTDPDDGVAYRTRIANISRPFPAAPKFIVGP